MQRAETVRPLAEIVAMAALLSSYIWGWQHAFPGHFYVCAALYFAIGLSAHVRRGESAADLGFRLDNSGPAAWNSLRFVAPLLLLPLGFGALLGSFDFPPLLRWPGSLLGAAVWGTLQQYGLLCVFYRRFGELLVDGRGQILAASLVFAVFHLPNPFLSLVTLGAGGLSCWLYRRVPNVLVLGVTHAVVSFVIVHSLPDTVTFGMRVGPGFFRFEPGD